MRLGPHLGPEAAPQTGQVGGRGDAHQRHDEGNEEGVEIMESFFRNKPDGCLWLIYFDIIVGIYIYI